VATTNFRESFDGHDLQAPTVNSLDFLGRPTTATADYLGRPLRRILRTNTTAVTVNQELAFAGGEKFIVTVAGTTAGSAPGVPAVGATVADGSATLLRQK
jgi:hypothetical protein